MSRLSSIWIETPSSKMFKQKNYPKLTSRGETFDVAIIGGGIVGCTTAFLLKNAGKRVALIEANKIGQGVTGFSTAKLSAQQGPIYQVISKQRSRDEAKLYYDMNIHAINFLEDFNRTYDLNCDFERKTHTSWTSQPENISLIEEEFQLCKELNFTCELVDRNKLISELPNSLHPLIGILFPNQAQFNPFKYCHKLCELIEGNGSKVFENSRVTSINESKSPHLITIDEHLSNTLAEEVVVSTHMPILNSSFHFSMFEPSRSHCIAAKITNLKIQNMFINVDNPTISLRSYGDENILIISGNPIKQGDNFNTKNIYEDLCKWTETHFGPHVEILYKWSAMDYLSGDHVPFIGYLRSGTSTLYTATAFSKWGLANGIAGAMLIKDLIIGDFNKYHHLVDARRWDIKSVGKETIKETVHTGKHFLGDKLQDSIATMSYKSLIPGEGRIIRDGFRVVGAYKDESGKVYAVNPICTHLGCNLSFNDGDRTWDCPCHGSQFDIEGRIIQGPAVTPLEKIDDFSW